MENELHHQSATFEKIWATLDRIAESQKKGDKKMKRIEKQIAENAEQMKDTDRRLKKTDELFNSQWGKLMESLVEGDLVPLLQKRGMSVTYTPARMQGRYNGEHYEFDILAEDGDEVVVVEVKTTLRSGDVAHFIEQLGKFTTYRPLYRSKKIYGAVAYLKADKSVQVHAERQGLFVIRATGSSASIVNDTEFVPRVF